jgi:hypothetical protein
MVEQQVANLPTTDRYRSPAPSSGSSKVERHVEAVRVGGASPPLSTKLKAWIRIPLGGLECFLIGMFVGSALAIWYRVWEISAMRLH